MTAPDLADELIARLNALIEDADVRRDISNLIRTKIPCSKTTANHPTIQSNDLHTLGFLGLLNGVVGTIPDGARKGWGLIAASFDDDHQLLKFVRSEEGDGSTVLNP